mmetsp:Transcript_51693/g.62280  ORF Transcript_51693/g.62280 Transcript_51693/m.62280 type:complete len:302 (-) Transcript_51693:244-1149(-)|eukprot:CAMPEP_0194424318 /NCGR_PEP_ID=MMETSP0176-20130528/23588_1 /TAXON_ID=216777 /ORGANISM="Proboscia alata, Strain PI-D3" /LENGTH=301 /DNA_ID=CAMNT_0039234013 /DNA_START=77 /DNA_END=982 /DNA_ORIENTATION=-
MILPRIGIACSARSAFSKTSPNLASLLNTTSKKHNLVAQHRSFFCQRQLQNPNQKRYVGKRLLHGNQPGVGPKEDPNSGGVGRGPVSWVNLGLIGVASAAAVAYYRIQRERRIEEAMGKIVTTGKPAIGAPWTLVDLKGNLVSEQTFAGKFTLLYFGFARCPDICPSEMQKVAQVMDTMKEKFPEVAANVQPIFVSIDPGRDSIDALRSYEKDFHPSYAFLTGTPQMVASMAKSYRVYVSRADETEDGDYLVDHSIVLYFHDDKGEMVDVFTQSMKPTDILDRIVGFAQSFEKKKKLDAQN